MSNEPGPRVARLFHRGVGVAQVIAWLSMSVQVRTLIGARGVAPWVRAQGVAGTVLDVALVAFCLAGAVIGTLSLRTESPRRYLAVGTAMYALLTIAIGHFAFPPDDLLLECGIAAALLPTDRRSPLVVFFIRLVLFKLYLETGLGKLFTPSHQWLAGRAMDHFYETVPIPTPLAPYANALPAAWHQMETWAALFIEVVVAWFVFGPRRARLFAAASFTALQLGVVSTCNFGPLPLMSTLPVLSLLGDHDVDRLTGFLRRVTRGASASAIAPAAGAPIDPIAPRDEAIQRPGVALWIALYAVVFAASLISPFASPARAINRLFEPLHVVPTYRMFDHVNDTRIEAEVQTLESGRWTARPVRYRPNDPSHPLAWVAPHLPRISMLFWFFATEFRRGMPPPMETLLRRVCEDPDAVESVFAGSLPPRPEAVRLVFWRYRYATSAERAIDRNPWRRTLVTEGPITPCTMPESRTR